jgi:uncharacterized protein RhaS with RHS repeats
MQNTDWYDYGARFYDPSLGRWHTMDPLAEYHFNMNPYHYVENNPIRYIDPFGLDREAREARRAKRKAKRDGKHYDIPELMVVGNKRQSKSGAREQARNDSKTWGIFLSGEGGKNGTNTIADGIWMDYDPIQWLVLAAEQTQYKKPGPKSDKEEATVGAEAAADALTSDVEIINDATENSPQANPEEQIIVKTYGAGKYKSWKGEPGSQTGSMIYRDATNDSSLLINASGDSLLFIPFSGGGKTEVSTDKKK